MQNLKKLKFIYCIFYLKTASICLISGFHRCINEILWDADSWLHMFRKNLSVPFSRVKMGPEKLSRKVGSYPSTLRNIPEERKVSVSISYYTESSDSATMIDQLGRIRKEVSVANFELLNQNVMGQNENTTSILLQHSVLQPELEYLPNTRRKSYPFKQRSYR